MRFNDFALLMTRAWLRPVLEEKATAGGWRWEREPPWRGGKNEIICTPHLLRLHLYL